MSLYKQPGSQVWWADISHPAHPRLRVSTGSTDRLEAQKVHDQLKADLWKRAPKLAGNTWGKAVTAWLEVEDRSESELLSLRKFGRHFKDRPLDCITGTDVEQALSFCQTTGTYMRYRTMVVAILNVARKRKWLAEVPDIPVRKDKKKKTREWLTYEQWEKLYDELPKHLRAPAVVAINTGLRQSNVFGLQWRDVDLDRKLIVVHAEDIKDNDDLAVPLNDAALAAIKAQAGLHHEFVFTYRGRPLGKPKTGFKDACIRAGLGTYQTAADGVRARGKAAGKDSHPDGSVRYVGFTWHGFRHTWASWHVQNGTPLEVLQKLGGWSDLRMVMNYAKFSPGFVAQFVNNVRKKT